MEVLRQGFSSQSVYEPKEDFADKTIEVGEDKAYIYHGNRPVRELDLMGGALTREEDDGSLTVCVYYRRGYTLGLIMVITNVEQID